MKTFSPAQPLIQVGRVSPLIAAKEKIEVPRQAPNWWGKRTREPVSLSHIGGRALGEGGPLQHLTLQHFNDLLPSPPVIVAVPRGAFTPLNSHLFLTPFNSMQTCTTPRNTPSPRHQLAARRPDPAMPVTMTLLLPDRHIRFWEQY